MNHEATIIEMCKIYEHWRKYHEDSDDKVFLIQSPPIKTDKCWMVVAKVMVNNTPIFKTESSVPLDEPGIDFKKMKEECMFFLATYITNMGMHTAYERTMEFIKSGEAENLLADLKKTQ